MSEAEELYETDDTDTQRSEEGEREALLEALGIHFAESRSECIRGRQQSNIELQWDEDEAFYQGVDAASAHDFIAVGDTNVAPEKDRIEATTGSKEAGSTRSTLFLNITRPFTDAAAARFGDGLIPQDDDRSFSLKPTPIPDQISIKDGKMPLRLQSQIEAELKGDPVAIKKAIDEVIAEESRLYKESSEKAERAQRQIDDWLVECNYHGHVRRVVDDAAQSGTGVLKGPEPYRQTALYFYRGRLRRKEAWAPGSKHVSYRNCFPDPAAGEDIQAGSCHWERTWFTARQLRKMAGQPGVFNDQLAAVLREGAHTAVSDWTVDDRNDKMPGLVKSSGRSTLYEGWYGYVAVSAEDAYLIDGAEKRSSGKGLVAEARRRRQATMDREAQAEAEANEDRLERGSVIDLDDRRSGVVAEDATLYLEADIDVKVVMVNNRIIRMGSNTLSEGKFPYQYFAWQRIPGLPWGKGVPRQMRGPQRIVLAGIRNMLDNAGFAAGIQLLIDQNLIEPADGDWKMRPRKVWRVKQGVTLDDVRKAMHEVKFDMLQTELQAIIMLGLRLAEDVSGLPALLQGNMGRAPDTVGGMNILNDNAASVIRRIARAYDDGVTEPSIRSYYDYLLLHTDDDNMKGDFQVDVTGSAMMVAREMSQRVLEVMMDKSTNPLYGLDPQKVASQWLKAVRFDARLVRFDDDDWKRTVEGMANMLANQKGVEQRDLLAMKLQHDAEQRQADRDQKEAFKSLEYDDKEADRQMQQAMQAVENDMLVLLQEYRKDGDEKKLQQSLAELVIKVRSQERLSAEAIRSKTGGGQVLEPAVEPAGRAAPGQAFIG